MKFRSPVDARDPSKYAKWIRELEGRSGVYVFRDRDTHEVLYVGESHSGRLRGTMCRHWQRWDGYQSGTLYDRHRVHVAVLALDRPAREVVRMQAELIAELAPRDNVHHKRAAIEPWAPPEGSDYDPDEFTDFDTSFDPAQFG